MTQLDLHRECPGVVVYRGFREAFDSFAADLGLGDRCLVEVTLANDPVISRVHAESHGDPSTTDCIAFPTGFPELGGVGLLGALYLGVEEIRRNAEELGRGFSYEAAFVLAHGMLHLLGHEDGTEAERQAMFARQEELLAGLTRRSGRVPRLLGLPRVQV